ncbi:MAG: hypothetical protein U0805_16760 [Pirellulales bacterium]
MSYSHSKPMPIGDALNIPTDWDSQFDQQLPFVQTVDGAIDSALKGVPLPAGMLSRLQRMVLAMPDGPAGHPLDYLGC